jgi:hypothetical protein
MAEELGTRLRAISKTHENDETESMDTLNASLLKQNTPIVPEMTDTTTEATNRIETLKAELQSLRDELQRFKDTGVEPRGIVELKAELE